MKKLLILGVLFNITVMEVAMSASCSGLCWFTARKQIARISKSATYEHKQDFKYACRDEGGSTSSSGNYITCIKSKMVEKSMSSYASDHFEARSKLRKSCKDYDRLNGGQGYGYMKNVACRD